MEFNILMAMLATWRIVNIIQVEKIGTPIRKWLAGEKEDVAGILSYKDNMVAYLTMCLRCLSMWVGLFCVIVSLVFPLFLYPFAISAAVIVLDGMYKDG